MSGTTTRDFCGRVGDGGLVPRPRQRESRDHNARPAVTKLVKFFESWANATTSPLHGSTTRNFGGRKIMEDRSRDDGCMGLQGQTHWFETRVRRLIDKYECL